MNSRFAFVLSIALFFAISSSPRAGQQFTWTGALQDGKNFKPDQFSHPAEALFDSVHSFDALHYRLDLNFTGPPVYFSGSMVLRFTIVADSLSAIRLNMVKLATDSAFINTTPSSFSRDDTSIFINFDYTHYSPETLSVRICYHDTVSGRGFFYYPWNSYTMAEPQDARWWFPCYDEPWDKATSEIYATVPENNKVGSNGYLAGVEHNSQNQTRTYHWVNDYPISTYLINLIIGDFATWTDYYINASGDSIPIFNMVAHEDSSAAAYDFATVPQMMAIYSRLFAPYPFDKYGQGAVSPFAFGAMENQTMTTLNRSWITGNRGYELGYAHELAHIWWGDMVTLADWRNIWLNEGFATYSSALFDEAFHGHDSFISIILGYQTDYFIYEQYAGSHPIYNPSDLFGLHVYDKGAWVLHMLRGLIGDSAFFNGLHNYSAAYAYSNASTEEFIITMENASGMNLDWFFDEWVYNQGYPVYNYAWSYQASGDSFLVHLDISQIQANAPIFRMPLTVRIVAAGNNDFVVQNNQQVQSYEFAIANPPETLILDPDYWILKQVQQVTSIDSPGGDVLPVKVEIENVYPNPFNSRTNISFSVEGRGQEIELGIYDLLGRLVHVLISGRLEPNRYLISWDGSDQGGGQVASGVYLVKLTGPHQYSTNKISYIK
jgi:aminopeptidase N